MEESGIWKIILVILLSTVKFGLGGVPLALGFGFSFFKAVVTTSLGGILGIITFSFLSDMLLKWVKSYLKKKNEAHAKRNAPKKKIFTFRNKMIVRVKRKYGLIGLAILTPSILSIPLGMLLVKRYFHNNQRVYVYMISSVIFWSVAISSFKLFF